MSERYECRTCGEDGTGKVPGRWSENGEGVFFQSSEECCVCAGIREHPKADPADICRICSAPGCGELCW